MAPDPDSNLPDHGIAPPAASAPPTIFRVSYEKWPWPENTPLRESDAYVLYLGDIPAMALANHFDSRSFLVIEEARKSKHFFRVSVALELLQYLFVHNVTVQTGLPGYSTLSPTALKMIRRVNDRAEAWKLIATPLQFGHFRWTRRCNRQPASHDCGGNRKPNI